METLREKLNLPEMPAVPTITYLKENVELEEITIKAPLTIEFKKPKLVTLKGKDQSFTFGGVTRRRFLDKIHNTMKTMGERK